jgi:hypothetical protein
MTSRFWTICAIPLLPMGAAAAVLVMTLLGERVAAKPEHRMIVVLAQSFHPVQDHARALQEFPQRSNVPERRGTGHSLQSEVR